MHLHLACYSTIEQIVEKQPTSLLDKVHTLTIHVHIDDDNRSSWSAALTMILRACSKVRTVNLYNHMRPPLSYENMMDAIFFAAPLILAELPQRHISPNIMFDYVYEDVMFVTHLLGDIYCSDALEEHSAVIRDLIADPTFEQAAREQDLDTMAARLVGIARNYEQQWLDRLQRRRGEDLARESQAGANAGSPSDGQGLPPQPSSVSILLHTVANSIHKEVKVNPPTFTVLDSTAEIRRLKGAVAPTVTKQRFSPFAGAVAATVAIVSLEGSDYGWRSGHLRNPIPQILQTDCAYWKLILRLLYSPPVMATASRQACRAFRQISRATPAKRKCAMQPLARGQFACRPFSSAAERRQTSRTADRAIDKIRQDGKSEEDIEKARRFYQRLEDPSQWQTPSDPVDSAFFIQHLSAEEQAEFEALPQADKDQLVAKVNHIRYEMELAVPTPQREGQALAESEDIAEGELEMKREIREYMRITAWEMPLLSQYAKPFEKPTHATPLRFRYTTYMGEHHPAQKKVVVEFATKDIAITASLTEAQRVKLIKLVGPRYNPSTDVVRMSSDKFEYAAQNKRYLGDLVGSLLAEAKNEDDMFEDIPLDFRHHKHTPKPQFPEGWKLTKRRVAELDVLRQQPLQQIAATEEAKRTEESKKRQRIDELVAAMPLGRREPSRRPMER
ncbi:hypothetical protein DV736_g2124, partial [Chaetothyriales sp. CBS 134916]